MSLPRSGELAALATAVCWACSSIAFARAGRRVGSLPVNLIRMTIALGVLALLLWAFYGQPWPPLAERRTFALLAVSGLVGFAFGDLCLFRSYVLLGPRLPSLLMSTAPPMTALLGWWALGEHLGAAGIAGIALTVAGIGWAVSERSASLVSEPRSTDRHFASGVLLALGGALGQAGGLVLSKLALETRYPVLAATEIRVFAGGLGFALLFSLTGQWRRIAPAMHDRSAMGWTLLGALCGPVAGVTLSLVAIEHAPTGIAAAIMATYPLFVIPLVVMLDRERVGLAGLGGALLAVAGVAVLFVGG